MVDFSKLKKNIKEFIKFLIYLFVGFGGIAIIIGIIEIIYNHSEAILSYLLGILFLILGGIGNVVNGLTSIKGLLIITVILLFVIINKLHNKN